MKSENYYLGILILFSSLVLFSNLSIFPVNIMEARNFITAREMLTDNHWLLTTINGMPRYEKPPLPTWLTAFSFLIFDSQNLFIARIPVVVSTLLLIIFAYLFSKKIGFSKKSSFHNGLLIIGSFYIFFAGRDNNWDMYCHSFMFISLYFFWKIVQNEPKRIVNILICSLFFAASILCKGPISPYTLFLPFLIAYFFCNSNELTSNKLYSNLLIVLIFSLLIALPWFFYVRFADPESFLKVAEKESSNWHSYNTKPLYYYWDFFLQTGIWAIPSLLGLLYPLLKSKVSNPKMYKFTCIWTVASLLLLSIIPEKKVRYLLPVLIPLALNTGFYIEYLIHHFSTLPKWHKVITYIHSITILLVLFSFPVLQFFFIKELRVELQFWILSASSSLFLLACYLAYFFYRKQILPQFYGWIFLQLLITALVFPLIKSFTNNTSYQSASILKRIELHNHLETFQYSEFSPEIVWDSGNKIALYNTEIPKKKSKFLLLVSLSEQNQIALKADFNDFTIKKLTEIDLNYTQRHTNSFNERLARAVFLLEKK